MPKLSAKTVVVLARSLVGLAILVAGCTSTPPPAGRPLNGFVIPTDLPNGRVEITIATSYALGTAASIQVTLTATRGTVSGPVSARVMASGINEAGAPAEVLVRELSVTPVTVSANGRKSMTLTWDTRDTKGVVVPADAYSLVLEVRAEDGGSSRTLTAGATLELR